MSRVFDASAVLALLNNEKGAGKAASLIAGSSLSAVNAIEVQQKLIDAGMPMPLCQMIFTNAPERPRNTNRSPP